jgi:hypothetical protein
MGTGISAHYMYSSALQLSEGLVSRIDRWLLLHVSMIGRSEVRLHLGASDCEHRLFGARGRISRYRCRRVLVKQPEEH